MKSLKKFTSVLLALVMALGLTCTAFATNYTITIDNISTPLIRFSKATCQR